MAKGKTKWYPRDIHPMRNGEYECSVRISNSVPLILRRLKWDGKGFLVPFPMVVHSWRGLTKQAAATMDK
jgi:hypothetical protein